MVMYFTVGSSAVFTLIVSLFNGVAAGVVDNVQLDPNYNGGSLVEFRMSECTHFPCKVRRMQRYDIEADILVAKDVENFVTECYTKYRGRRVSLPGHGGCDNLTNGTCPLIAGKIYTSATHFTLPFYVPPMLYEVHCYVLDDNGEMLLKGSGSGRVV